MRARSSIPGLVVVLAATLSGCKAAEEPSVTRLTPAGDPDSPAPSSDPPLPTDPAKLEELLRSVEQLRAERDAVQSPETINEIRERPRPGAASQAVAPLYAAPPPNVEKLYFQCADDVTFAVRTAGGRLEVSPPGLPNDFVVLLPQPSEPGTHYFTADRAEFRFDGELATLTLGRDRWADCVSNPAAAVWQEPARRGAR